MNLRKVDCDDWRWMKIPKKQIINVAKIQSSTYLIKHNIMKAYGGSGCQFPRIFNLSNNNGG
jgi:hypothetical protein